MNAQEVEWCNTLSEPSSVLPTHAQPRLVPGETVQLRDIHRWLEEDGRFGIGIVRCDVTRNPFLTLCLVAPTRGNARLRWMLWLEAVTCDGVGGQCAHLMVLPVSSDRLCAAGITECSGVLVDRERVRAVEQNVEGGARAVAVEFPHLLMLAHTFGVHVVQQGEHVLPTNWRAAVLTNTVPS